MDNTYRRPTPPVRRSGRKKKISTGKMILGIVLKALLVLFTTVVIIAATLFISLKMMALTKNGHNNPFRIPDDNHSCHKQVRVRYKKHYQKP